LKYKVELFGLLFSFIIGVIFWEILIVPTKAFIVSAIALVFFSTYRYMIYDDAIYRLTFPKLRKIPFACLIILSAFAILFIRPINDAEFIAWNAIPPLSLLRLVLGSFLTLFSPGYMLLSLIDRKDSLTGTEKIFFSIVLSLFLLPFFGCLCFALGSSILQSGTLFIIILNFILLLLYILFKKDNTNKRISVNLNEKFVLLSLLTFITILLLEKYILNLTWDAGDLDKYYGYSVCFTKEIFPIGKTGPGLVYPYWPFIFVAEFFIVSGVPYVNAFQFINIPISFMPVLSFYIMTSAFFRKHKIPVIATLLGSFGGGFGWIFGIHLLLSDQTNETLYRLFNIMAKANSGYLVPSFYTAPGITGIYPLYTYALTSIFTLIWLIYSKHAAEIENLRYILISVMIALGYLAHIAEIVFFVFIFLISFLIFKNNNPSLYRKCAVSIICGLVLVALPDIIVGGSQYIWEDPFTYYGFSLYFGTIGLAVLAFLLSFVKVNLKIPLFSIKIDQDKLRALKVVCSSLIIYVYFLCFIIWSKVYEINGSLPMQNHTVPWYAWVNRFGISGLIALPGIIYLIYKGRKIEIKEHLFFLLLVPVSFVIARIIHIYSSFYFEDRITFFIMIPITILASFTLFKLVQFLKKCAKENIRNIVLGSVLVTILVFGFLPGLIVNEAADLNYWSKGKQLSSSELDALNFLRLNTPSNASVLTLTDRSKRLLSYAGLFPVQTDINIDPSLILSIVFPETVFYSLAKSQLKYIYLASMDQKELEENLSYAGIVRSQLLEYLPIAFQNNEVTIYEVPKFAFSTNSSTAFVIPYKQISMPFGSEKNSEHSSVGYIQSTDFSGDNILLPMSMIALSQTEYSTILEDDPARFRYQTLILTHDLNIWDEIEKQEFQKYLQWINQGGRLIILESLGAYWPYESRNLTLDNYLGWGDENLSIGWTAHECSVSLNGTISVIRTTTSDKSHDLISPAINVSIKDYPYLVIRWKTDGSPLYLYSHGTESGYHYINLGTSVKWSISIINLKNFYDFVLKNNTGFRDSEQIDRLLFRCLGKNATYYIDYVRFYREYPPTRPAFADLLQIYSKGLSEIDGIQSQMGRIDFPTKITIPTITLADTSVKVIANYTKNGKVISPYALVKKVGDGEVIYIVASPYFFALKNSTDRVKRDLFKELGYLIDILDLKLKKNVVEWTNYFPQFDYSKGPVNLSGKVTLDTSYIKFPKLELDYIKIISDKEGIKMISFNDSVINKIEYSDQVTFRIDASRVYLSESSLGRYLNIRIAGDFNLTVEISRNGTVEMSILNGTTPLNMTFQEGVIQLNFRNNETFVLIKNPNITVEGSAYFNRIRAYRNHYKMPLFYDDGSVPLQIIGTVKFKVECSDNGISFIDRLVFNGKWFYPSIGQKESFTEKDIPWFNVIASPLNLLLITVIIFFFLMGYALSYLKRIKIKVRVTWAKWSYSFE